MYSIKRLKRLSNYTKMVERSDHSVITDRVSHIVCRYFDIFRGIAHGDSDSGKLDERDVIAPIPESHTFLRRDSQPFKNQRRTF